jgi:hypothetical protein
VFITGLFIALGLIVTFSKLGWKWRMRMLSYPVLIDVAVFVFLTLVHWGTFSGVMGATIGAFIVSLMLSLARCVFGYCEGKTYHRGWIDVYPHLAAEKGKR